MTNFTPIVLLAFIVEGIVEYLAGTPFDKFPKLTPHKWLLMYVSAVFGVGIALYYKVDVLPLVDLPASVVGQVMTGILLSRGANFIADLWSKFFPGGKPIDNLLDLMAKLGKTKTDQKPL